MSFDTTPAPSDAEIAQRVQRYPRNIWTKFRAALHKISTQDFYGAQRLLEGLRYHPDATEEVVAIYWNRLRQAQAQHAAVHKINIPTDYSGTQDPRLLLPFRKLQADQAVPKPYPWAMALPAFAGAGNAYRFLQDSAAALAGQFTPAIRRVNVIWSPLEADDGALKAVLEGLRDLSFAGRIDLTIFGRDRLDREIALPGDGALSLRPHGVQSPAGQAEMHKIAQDCDLVIFLTGAPAIDTTLLQRAIHLAEISDAVVQPLVPLIGDKPAQNGFATLYSDAPVRERFSGRYPFRDVAGLNMVIPARMLREIGVPDPRFSSTFLAGRALAYRAYVRGAWLVPLAVHTLTGFSDQDRFPADAELYKALCPNHWDRKRDVWHEVSKVSVYIPAYNASKYIERAVESVLQQDVADLEVCIANDGSRDGTLALLERLYAGEKRVRWLDNPNGGIGFASNAAIRMSNSLYIGQLDSDDCLKPGAVRRLMTVLDDNPSVVCAYGSCERIDAAGAYMQDEYAWPVFSREKMMITSIAHHFRMFRRQTWERTTRFREDIVNGVDYDIFLKMSEVGEFRHVEEKLYQRRWHGENTSHVNEHHQTANTHRVQREALARQDLSRFWDVHAPDPEKPRNVTYTRPDGVPMLMFWPDYSRGNPYQKMLYAKASEKAEVVTGDIDAALRAIETKTVRAQDVTFHLHWLNALFRGIRTEAAAQSIAETFVTKLVRLRLMGGRLVWTIHNTLSHDTAFAAVEAQLSERIAEIADIIHLHSAASLFEVTEAFELAAEKVRISPHGHYVGAYPDFVSRSMARQYLGIEAEEDVILFTGLVRPYKGVDDLVTAFRRILADRPKARLIIAGHPWFDPLEGLDPALTEAERARILSTGRFVEEGELQLFFRAADIAAYPYQKILTSGSLLLALSFGVPTVIPRVGMTVDVLEGQGAGHLYDPDEGLAGLETGLRRLLQAKDRGNLTQMASKARARALSIDWPDFGAVLE